MVQQEDKRDFTAISQVWYVVPAIQGPIHDTPILSLGSLVQYLWITAEGSVAQLEPQYHGREKQGLYHVISQLFPTQGSYYQYLSVISCYIPSDISQLKCYIPTQGGKGL